MIKDEQGVLSFRVESLEGRTFLSGGAQTLVALHQQGPAHPAAVVARRATPAAASDQPDLLLRDYQFPTPENYSGGNVFSTNGAGETLSQNTDFFPAIYQLAVRNNGSRADSFTISGGGGTKSGWRVSYYDSQVQGGLGGSNITAAVQAGTYRTPTLQPGEMFEFRVEVGPASFAPGGNTRPVNVAAASVNSPSKIDVIGTLTNNQIVHGVQINRRNYDASGSYEMELENIGNNKDYIRVVGEAGGAGWTARYYTAFAGGTDVTSQVTNGGWITGRLSYGNVQQLLVKIIATDGQTHTAQVIAQSAYDNSKTDVSYVTNTPQQARPGFFPIAIFSQPEYLFDTWKSRGVNTIFNYESLGGQNSLEDWTQAAADKGLKVIREPAANPADDVGVSNLLAWAFADEPDVPGHSGYLTPQQLVDRYNQLKAIDPNLPIFGNFDGSDVVQWQHDVSVGDYQTYVQGTDWDSQGIYPVTAWNRPDNLEIPGRAVNYLQNWSGGKMQWAIIESSPQNATFTPKGTPGANAAQFRAEIWDSVIQGAQGIVYFPQALDPNFSYDNTQSDVAAEMTRQDAILTQFGAALQSSIDPATLGLVAPQPLEGTWRSIGGKSYFFVLNNSASALKAQPMALQGLGRARTAIVAGENRTVSLDKHGNFSDSFAPYSLHIYQLG